MMERARGDRVKLDGREHTTIELGSGNDHHEHIGAGVLLCDVVAYEACHGADDEHRQELKADHALRCCVSKGTSSA